MVAKEAASSFLSIKGTTEGLKQTDLESILVPKMHQTKTSVVRLKYLQTVKHKIEKVQKNLKKL